MAHDTDRSDVAHAPSADLESRVAAFADQLDRDDVPEEAISAGFDAAVSSAPEVVKVAELLAAGGGPKAELRLRHLSALIDRGALDHDIFEAIAKGAVYCLSHDAAAARLIDDFRLRCRCDLSVLDSVEGLLDAVAERMPDLIVLGASDPSAAANAVLPELVVAAFDGEPVPVVLLAEDDSCLVSFEVLTYPVLTYVQHRAGVAGLLAAIGQFLSVEYTTGTLETGKELKDKIGLTKAQAIQHNLLPEQIPELPGLEIAAYYNPCQEVGGDYYDFLPLSDGRLGVVCADVSGKGVGAAMVMVMFRSILRLAAQDGSSPHQVITRTNQLVTKDMLKGMFVSAVYLIVNPETRGVELVNAGHMPVMHWPVDRPRPVNLVTRGMVLGLAGGKKFAEATHQAAFSLQAGDLFCLYSDGIVEAEDRGREQFGPERLARTLRDAGRDAAPQQILDQVVAAIDAFCAGAPQHDDATLIVVKAV